MLYSLHTCLSAQSFFSYIFFFVFKHRTAAIFFAVEVGAQNLVTILNAKIFSPYSFTFWCFLVHLYFFLCLFTCRYCFTLLCAFSVLLLLFFHLFFYTMLGMLILPNNEKVFTDTYQHVLRLNLIFTCTKLFLVVVHILIIHS